MGLSSAPEACPVPDFSLQPVQSGYERPGTDIQSGIKLDGNTVTVPAEATKERMDAADPDIAEFRENLLKMCSGNEKILKSIVVSTHVIKNNPGATEEGKVFIVSDKNTGKVLSYHAIDGKCLIDVKKRVNPTYIALENAAGKDIQYEIRQENGVLAYYLVITKLPWVDSIWPEWEHREGAPVFNDMMIFNFIDHP